MSVAKAKWKDSFRKTRSLSQSSLSSSVKRKTSLLEEGDFSLSDNELEEYLGTIKKKSGLNRLWTGNTFDKVIDNDRTPDVSISSVSTDSEVPVDEDKTPKSDNDFLPNIMALPSIATEENNTDISEPSSIRPFQAVNLMSDLELSEAPLNLENNVKLALSKEESAEVVEKEIRSVNIDVSDAEEVQTVDEISEEIEEDLSGNTAKESASYLSKKDKSHRQKDRHSNKRSEKNTYSESDHNSTKTSQSNSRYTRNRSRHSGSGSKSKHSSSEHSSKKETRTHSKHSKTGNSRKSHHKSNVTSESHASYTTDFSEYSQQTETDVSSKSSSQSRSAVSSTKLQKSIEELSKTTKHKGNLRCHDVATQVSMDGINGQRLGVGMATLGPSFGQHYVDPSPIARHVVSADAIEAVTAYNPAVVALTDMLRQQLKLVEQFVDNSRRMYESYTSNLNTTYKYTTLEDTLQYIDESENNYRQKQFK